MFHKVKSVTPMPDYVLLAHFTDGSDRLYDMKRLFAEYPVFRTFETIPGLFQTARADVGGFGIIWNEDIDIDAEEVYRNGRDCKTAFSDLTP